MFSNGSCQSTRKLEGKTAIVTGASAGIGVETARNFAARGARVIMACRNISKGEKVAESIRSSTNNQEVKVSHLDLASLDSVRKFAAEIVKTETQLHILVNNAGITFTEGENKIYTDDGLELIMASNHYGHFLLTNLLGGLLKSSAPSRIVIVSSQWHRTTKSIDFEDMNYKTGSYSNLSCYGRSKLCNVLMAKHLAVKLEGTGVNSYSLHPGFVNTDIFKPGGVFPQIAGFAAKFVAKSVKSGSQTSIFCAVDESCDNQTGLYYQDCKVTPPSALTDNPAIAEKLWQVSCEDVKLTEEEQTI